MTITKETFIQSLKDNNFYDAWMEGYTIDNEIYNDNVPLDWFLEKCPKDTWLYYGISALATETEWPVGFEALKARHSLWRKAHLSDYIDLDEKWTDFVHKNEVNNG